MKKPVSLTDFKYVGLYQEIGGIKTQVEVNQLNMPDYGNIDDSEVTPQGNFFADQTCLNQSTLIDSDRDGISDDWEINGYTVIGNNIVKWNHKFNTKRFKKYTSNPFKARTANDPYTDCEKVIGLINKSVSLVARDPMVAAYPSIGVVMEHLVVSQNNTVTTQAGASMSKNSASSFTESNTKGVSASFGVSGLNVQASVSETTQRLRRAPILFLILQENHL